MLPLSWCVNYASRHSVLLHASVLSPFLSPPLLSFSLTHNLAFCPLPHAAPTCHSTHFSLSLPDFNDVIPETQRLDSSLQKARAQLSAKGRRQRPSRSRLRDSVSSAEGDDFLEKKVSSQTLLSALCISLAMLYTPTVPIYQGQSLLVPDPDQP